MLTEMYERYLCWTIATVPTGFFFSLEDWSSERSQKDLAYMLTHDLLFWIYYSVKYVCGGGDFSRWCHWLFCFQSISDKKKITLTQISKRKTHLKRNLSNKFFFII